MGLDIYAGTLTRYYGGNWKTLVQKYAEDNGIPFQTVRSGGGEKRKTSPPERVCEVVSRWRDAVAEALHGTSNEIFPRWEETDTKEYATDKPDWDAYGALALFSAALQLGENFPQTVERGWAWYEHPLLLRARQSKLCRGTLANGVELWLPFAQNLIFRYTDIYGNEAQFGTVGGLLSELDGLNQAAWGADRETIRRWRSAEGYGAEYDLIAGQLTPCGERQTHYSTESLAKFAFSILYALAQFAQATGVPLKLDY